MLIFGSFRHTWRLEPVSNISLVTPVLSSIDHVLLMYAYIDDVLYEYSSVHVIVTDVILHLIQYAIYSYSVSNNRLQCKPTLCAPIANLR